MRFKPGMETNMAHEDISYRRKPGSKSDYISITRGVDSRTFEQTNSSKEGTGTVVLKYAVVSVCSNVPFVGTSLDRRYMNNSFCLRGWATLPSASGEKEHLIFG